jgi:hypothetical protein
MSAVPAEMRLNIWLDSSSGNRRIIKSTAGIEHGDNSAFDYDGKIGFWDTYSSDPDSPDYNPAGYNRCLTYLHSKGAALDVPLVPLRSRSLKDRWALLSDKRKRDIINAFLRNIAP